MNILMLGNSFTYYHDMPGMLAEEIGGHVVEVVRGGAFLRQFLDAADPLAQAARRALSGTVCPQEGEVLVKAFGAGGGAWDYVVLQEQSFNAAGDPEGYAKSVGALCALIRAAGAKPVLYSTWAYRADSEKMKKCGMSHAEMLSRMQKSCRDAAKAHGALCAEVGAAFEDAIGAGIDVYEADDYHPSEAGSRIAAKTIAEILTRE